MIFGNPSAFAIETEISQVFPSLSLRALGYFVIYLKNKCYGVRSLDATMLACTFDEIYNRISLRGKHKAPFSSEKESRKIAESINFALYADNQEEKSFFNLTHSEFCSIVHGNKIIWAPDGDEAFDDDSFVFQFDINESVRLIACRFKDDFSCDTDSLADITIKADEYYDILQRWHDWFLIQTNINSKANIK
jgi:hypothetical protein